MMKTQLRILVMVIEEQEQHSRGQGRRILPLLLVGDGEEELAHDAILPGDARRQESFEEGSVAAPGENEVRGQEEGEGKGREWKGEGDREREVEKEKEGRRRRRANFSVRTRIVLGFF